jgi:prephenate dehydrogenase
MTPPHTRLRHVHIVGTGLIGASIGLALHGGEADITLEDRNDANALLAQDRGAGRVDETGIATADVVVIAVPPAFVVPTVERALRLNVDCTVMDVASVKSGVVTEAETRGADLSRFIPTHPIAGRERGGPAAARGDLFHGRTWVLTPVLSAAAAHLARAEFLISTCGARPLRLPAADHDAAMALLSHLPQLLSSVLAAQLPGAPFDVALLAGQGLRDTTRLAASDAGLWADIVASNAREIAPLLDRVRSDLDSLAQALRSDDPQAAVSALVERGQEGRARVGATHGGPAVPVDVVSVLLPDTPGEMARIFDALREAGINVDDVRIDHAPGEAVGVLEIVVGRDAGPAAVAALGQWEARVASRS